MSTDNSSDWIKLRTEFWWMVRALLTIWAIVAPGVVAAFPLAYGMSWLEVHVGVVAAVVILVLIITLLTLPYILWIEWVKDRLIKSRS